MLLIGLAVEYWYISLALLTIVVAASAVHSSHACATRPRGAPAGPCVSPTAAAVSPTSSASMRSCGCQLAGAADPVGVGAAPLTGNGNPVDRCARRPGARPIDVDRDR